jgi:alpha-N-arabinofuranosidase
MQLFNQLKAGLKTTFITLLAALVFTNLAPATEYFVAPSGNDSNSGNRVAPLRTIQHGAELAMPGDVVTVRAGLYREWVNPPRGGVSDKKRIVFQAFPGERVELVGSEMVTNWAKVQDDVWQVVLPNAFFGNFNPYNDLIHGDWFEAKGRAHHTGAVYLNGDWLVEAARLEEVLMPAGTSLSCLKGGQALWFAQVDQANTTIWAQFKGVNPNEQLVEINVRRTVFYPDQPSRNYITVRNLVMRQAATPWAPPTAEQVGLIGTHWSKGWIIENNVISHSICSGVALGKYGDLWDNTSANTAEGYVKTIERAMDNGWNRQTIGHHIVRNNTISHCEQTAIVGSLGAAFSTISGNTIHDIHVRKLFTGAEMAGIKFHGAIDAVIRSNHIYRTCLGLWLDWMAQGTRVSGNLFHDNSGQDLFVEVDHGPFMVDNNLFLSKVNLLDMSEGGAYAHNLFAGKIVNRPEPSRKTPYLLAHSTIVAGLMQIRGGDDRFYNNVLMGSEGASCIWATSSTSPTSSGIPSAKDPEWNGGFGLWVYDFREQPLQTGGNVYYNGARPYANETNPTTHGAADPTLRLIQEGDRFLLHLKIGPDLAHVETPLVTSRLLGTAKIPQVAYESDAGATLTVDTDYFGKPRSKKHPKPGPFENPGPGDVTFKLR